MNWQELNTNHGFIWNILGNVFEPLLNGHLYSIFNFKKLMTYSFCSHTKSINLLLLMVLHLLEISVAIIFLKWSLISRLRTNNAHSLTLLLYCPYVCCYSFSYARMAGGGQAGGHPHMFPHNNFSSVYRIFTKLAHTIPMWKGKTPFYFGVIRSKVKVTVTINRIFDNRVVSAR